MAGLHPDAREETGPMYDDQELEIELRHALKSEPEIELFKEINRAVRVKDELANNETIKAILQDQWRTVADFFDAIVHIGSLQDLQSDHPLVTAHKDMQAGFRAVASVNMIFKNANSAEAQLVATDQLEREQ